MPSALMLVAIVLLPFALFLAVQLLFLPIVATAAVAERRLVWPYLPVDRADGPRRGLFEPESGGGLETIAQPGPHLEPHAYTREVDRAACLARFRRLGIFADGEGRRSKVRYDFFLSPDRRVLALVGAGAVASTPVAALELFTRLADGGLLVTINQKNAGEVDLARIRREVLIPDRSFDAVLARHLARIEADASAPLPYSEADPLGDHRSALARRVDELERIGAAIYLDPTRSSWRYTVPGGVGLAIRTLGTALRRIFRADR